MRFGLNLVNVMVNSEKTMKKTQFFYSLCLTNIVSLVLVPSVLATQLSPIGESSYPMSSNIPLLAQQSTTSAIQITGVKLEQTDTGLEIILETKEGDKLQVKGKSENSLYLIDIPNSSLRFPSGSNSFLQANPIPGISEVAVNNVEGNTIRITVKGTTGVPKVELFDGDEGLIFGVIPADSAQKNSN